MRVFAVVKTGCLEDGYEIDSIWSLESQADARVRDIERNVRYAFVEDFELDKLPKAPTPEA